MIIRKKQNIRSDAEEVSLMLSFAEADIKQALKKYYLSLADACNPPFAMNTPLSELDLVFYFENTLFAMFPQKYKSQLATWAFSMSLRHHFIIKSNDELNLRTTYFFSEKIGRRRGRPALNNYNDD